MPIVDITRDYTSQVGELEIAVREVKLKSAQTAYTGLVYQVSSDSMQGSYLDLPGHIKETDDGLTAANIPAEKLYRLPTSVIRLERASGSGAVSAADLERAYGGSPDSPAIIVNALGKLNPREVAPRSVYLDLSAVKWLIASGCRLLVSDIYESTALEGVFLHLFQAGIWTYCEPVNLAQITPPAVKLTVLFPKIARLTQIPCRGIVEW